MPILAASDFLKRAAKENLRAAYVFAGKEDYFRGEARRALVQRLTDNGGAEMRRLDRSVCRDWAALATEARTAMMWSPRQILLMTLDKRFLQSDLAPLESYLQAPHSATVLVFDWPEPDERLKFALLLKKEAERTNGAAAWVSCDSLRELDLKRWLEEYVRGRNVKFAPGAIDYLLEMCGTNLALLVHEVDKATLYDPSAVEMTKDTLRAVASSAREFAWYDLTDALGARDADKAMRVLKRLLDAGENPVGLLAVTAPHLRKLLKANVLLAKGKSERDVLMDVGVRFYGEKFIKQVRAFKSFELERALAACFRADRALKTQSAIPDRVVLEQFVLSMVR